jgi:hypothetical protein
VADPALLKQMPGPQLGFWKTCVVGLPLASLRVVRILATAHAGSPPRRAGNFSLLRQRKVTKREALNRTPASLAVSAHDNNHSLTGRRDPLLSLSPASLIAASARLTRGCTPCSRGMRRQRRSGDATAAQPRWRHPSDAVFAD